MKYKRGITVFICFILWGVLIIAAALRQIISQRAELLDFTSRVAAKNVVSYAPRAPIVDRNGVAVAYSEWQFYMIFSGRNNQKVRQFCRVSGIPFKPQQFNRRFCLEIPPVNLNNTLENAKKFKLRMRKREIRKTLPLPHDVSFKLGKTLFRHGLYGLEKKYNSHLQGNPGFYQIMLGPAGSPEVSNMKIFLPLKPGKVLKLKQSLFELQCGIAPQTEEGI